MPPPGSHGVIRVDEDARIVELDDVAERVFGLRRTEAIGRPIAEFVASSSAAGRHLDREGGNEVDVALRALLDSAEEKAQMGTWAWDLETNQLEWSNNLYRIFGLEPGGVTPTQAYVLTRVHPDDRERVESEVKSVRREGRHRSIEYRIVGPEGDLRHLQSAQADVEQAGGRILGSVQDVTERRRAERQLAAYVAISEALAEWQTLEQGATGLLRNVAGGMDCAAGVLWLPEGDVLVAQAFWPSGSNVMGLESVIRQLRLPRGVGLAGRAWEMAQPVAAASLADDPRFSAAAAAVAEVRGAAALPASHGQEVLAVLEFYFCESVAPNETDRLLRSLAGIGYELGLFLAHRRGELRPSALTPRERQVLQLAAQGRSGPEIAEWLVVSPATVRSHFDHIYDKYGVSDRAAAVAKALREGLIE